MLPILYKNSSTDKVAQNFVLTFEIDLNKKIVVQKYSILLIKH